MPRRHIDNDKGDDKEGDGHDNETVMRARAMMRGTGKMRGTTTAATPLPPPCTTRGMRTMWRGMTGTTMTTNHHHSTTCVDNATTTTNVDHGHVTHHHHLCRRHNDNHLR